MVLVSYRPIILVGCMAIGMNVLHAGRACATLPCLEEPMTTVACITAFCCQVDDPRPALPTPPHALWWPRAAVPLGIRPALTGGGHRHGRGAPLAGARAALGRAPAHLGRARLPGPRGGSRPAHPGSARWGAGPPACGNGVRAVDAEPSRHAGQAPWVGVLPRPPRV